MRAVTLIAFFLMMTLVILTSAEKKIFCYYLSSSIYRPKNGYFDLTRDIDTSLCTHLIYSFVMLKNNEVNVIDPWADLSADSPGGGRDGFSKFNALRQKNPALKTLVALGEWSEHSKTYSEMAKNTTTRMHFAANAVDFVRKYKFNGLDLIWRYPAQYGGAPEDLHNYIELLKVMNEYFADYNLILSASVAPTESSASKSYIISEMSKYLDFINVMTFHFHLGSDNRTDVHAPLYPGSEEIQAYKGWNVKESVDYWLSQGCPKEKMIVGIPFYGISFTLCNPKSNHIGSDACGNGEPGPYSQYPGILGYNEICEQFQNETWSRRYESERVAPFASRGSQWITYDHVRSIREKAKFIKKMNLGGAMVVNIDTDDFRGICGEKNLLLKTVNNILRN